ncbi:hypothetical protein FGSG_04680 [Fusarium graminearum PH-1]|uniref:hypothetical protein n=1 Tax=Gibberella zeae (strain ATCC MYA-4620 / CBS 123657 / FGSC 9075 / NRRL 31084 / PH-1) TaxID=229533 RepID=UPI000023EF98|nr:hypothetical protein FGSG_04680 [Fusarium graminearum PH-1]ESU08387.1 hypothetical protein FGSG_04680 [Fusarium graminearum PH-1]|eukprot:XP_011320886.1 hypothetical protein FGSG_04680 [Fusarium graminearum PH-1]
MRGQEEAFIPWIDKYGELLRVCGIHENVGTSEYARPFSTVTPPFISSLSTDLMSPHAHRMRKEVYAHAKIASAERTLEDLSKSLEERDSILARLFPNRDISDLVSLSDQELRDIVLNAGPSPNGTTLTFRSDHTPNESITQDSQWDEDRRERDPLPAEADDVNALSLPLDRQASYLGISSIRAALGAILQMRPQLRASLASRQESYNETSSLRDNGMQCTQMVQSPTENPCVKWSRKGQALVDVYFKRIHIMTPLLDETSFRTTYLSSNRHDSPWLALLNMVLAMGSIAASKSSDREHYKYYTNAMRHLDISAFGSSQIETLQALAIVGGHYLHYINRPNRGNAILGAAFRMASALGFHREPSDQDKEGDQLQVVELRRRIWWCLVCLDTLASMTLGRPSFGRFCPSIDIQPPKFSTGGHGQLDSEPDMDIMLLAENIRFCRIATEIQDKLTVTPFLKPSDRDRFDDMLISWFDSLPSLLGDDQECDELVHLGRSLLDAASKPGVYSQPADQDAIEKCQLLSKTAIEDIAQSWKNDQMSGWNAVWHLYQAVMIPLLSMVWQPQNPAVSEWKSQIEMVLGLFESMRDWSLTARCSKRVVSQIYETIPICCNAERLQLGSFDMERSSHMIRLSHSSQYRDSSFMERVKVLLINLKTAEALKIGSS